VYNFLKLSNSPQLTALGGTNISNQSGDIGMVFQNPSLLRESMHTQTAFVFNSFYGDIKNYFLGTGYHSKALETTFALGINYFNYGNITQTDAAGNILGGLRPVDYVIQVGMSRSYINRWVYGGSIKFIRSDYGMYKSSGLAADLALSYLDTARGIQSSFVIKNLGGQLNSYGPGGNEELPFDLQIGVSKKLSKAPFQFSITANRLHRFDIVYNDTAYNNENGLNSEQSKWSFDNIFRHIILSVQAYVTDKVELSAGYNYLRRKELNMGNAGNGINGFSVGVGVLFRKIQLRYGRAYYQSSRSYHQLGINIKLNETFSLGKFGEKMGWKQSN
jgi:hypothetical protein